MGLGNISSCLPLLVILCCSVCRIVLSQAKKCPAGYQVDPSDKNKCIDIDECEQSPCEPRKRCVNTPSSYWCECKDGYTQSNQDCQDIDECASSLCAHEATCQNTDGSFQCICSEGFNSSEKAGSNGRRTCEDIDECKSSPCHKDATCSNSVGSYQCDCNTGFQASPATATLTAGKVCEDIDECKSSPCPHRTTCNNTLGSYQCNCIAGFQASPATASLTAGKVCEDIDECKSSPCSQHATCNNILGSYQCNCIAGFQASPATATLTAGKVCEDIDECKSSPCDNHATCTNTNGSYQCNCIAGFKASSATTSLTAGKVCEDIDECKSSPCKQNAICNNTLGSYQCNCITGFQASPATATLTAGKVCEDIDECESSSCDSHATCKNTFGSYQCICNVGLKLSSEISVTGGRTCDDVDECANETVCPIDTTCRNTFGSFYCVCEAGHPPAPGDTHQACRVDPLDCPGSEKQNSTMLQCDPNHSWNSQQLNSAKDMLKLADCYRDKVCQNFSGKNDTKVMTAFVNNILNSSRLDTMKTAERLKVATATLDLLENMAMAIALTLPNSTEETIKTDSFVLKVKVPGGKNMSANELVKVEAQNNSMEIFWGTIAGGNNTEFVAVSLLVFNDMESLLNKEIERDQQETVPLNSKVVSATISNKAVSSKLKEMVNVTLKFNQEMENKMKEPECVFWRKTKEGNVWSPEGCKPIVYNQTHVTCQCDHLTSFAVLMAPVKIEYGGHLDVITYIGLTISLLCLAASIAIFINCTSIQNANTTVHKHLSLTLFLAQFIFLIGMQIKHPVVCGLVAGCLHYFFLSVFSWMFLDSLQLFIMSRHLTVTNYTRTHIIKRRYLYISGYAVPAVIVIISAAIYPRGYGTKDHCWLNHKFGFNWSFQGPVCVVIVVNTVLLVWTLYLLKRHFDSRNKEVSKLKETKTLTLKAAARMFVLGCTWIFGIFQFDESTMVFSHLFTVLNSLQGLFIFLIYCVFNRRVVDEVQKWLTSKHKTFTIDSTQTEMNTTETYKTTPSEGRSKTQ
ncbi:adhesion G protein-coupled receptor E1-like isoform X2 [Pristis pectinata]|uniref:adhesion G protein-coupled receptor E1-like isoform X2 n=1 Tax=Pristis pectinata TaxID=685728 RepID=UPI00223DE6A1|nr:adhesion G protein-coupled receptor E1-like isoform X2 [Pristis pectinata]